MSRCKHKIALIGCGAVAAHHAVSVQNLENAELIGVYDRSQERAKSFAAEHGIAAYASIEALLASDAEVVGICTPSGLHAPLAIQCLHAGKHVLVEKPIALTVDDCEAILRAERESGKICAPVSQMRYYDDIQRAKQILDSGVLGKPVLCDLYMKYYRKPEYYHNSWHGTLAMDGGGALMNQGIHGVDMLHFLFGPITTVSGIIRTQVHAIEAEDTAVSTVSFANGAIGVIEGTTSVKNGYPRRLEIHCEKGNMILQENRIFSIDLPGIEIEPPVQSVNSAADPMNIPYEGHRRQYANLLAAIDGTEPLFYTAAEAAETVKTILAIYQSSREERVVRL